MILRRQAEKSQAGFTIIEMVIVLFFAVILVTVLFGLYDWHSKYYAYQQALVRVSSTSRASVQSIQAYVSQATQVLSSATVNGTSYSSSANTLVMQLPSVDSSNNIISGKYDAVAFYSSGSNFYLQLQPDPASSRLKLNKILSDNLQNVNFIYNNGTFSLVNEVTVDITSQLQVKSQTVKSELKQDMYLLNF